jgi:uncharacterized Zn-binding protein involved in type VI secretion
MRRIPFARLDLGLGLGFGLALALAVTLSGCAELPGSPLDLQASRQAALQAVPISGSCELAIQPAQPVSPGVIRQLDVGTCQLSHLGKSTFVSDKVINLMAGTQTAQVSITAANGDILYASGTGTNAMVAPGKVAFRVDFVFTGGTGRFAAASGTAVSEGEADLVNAQSRLTLNGSIAY